ncbi:MAG TPA: acyl-CoA desaturase [Acidimicrobiales bacterium]|nr:acyl-CoA desaturase [Acidimicrobiales bacterium]
MSTVQLELPAASDRVPSGLRTGEPELKKTWEQVALVLFIAVPFAAVVAAVPVGWGWGVSWRDLIIAVGMYAITGHGITVGFHRHFTHHAFKASNWLRAVLAVSGMMAVQGPVIRWVADHRRHHRFTDRDGDPHSPWRYGRGLKALTKGFAYSHLLWLFETEQTCDEKFAPDLCRDPLIGRLSRAFPAWVVASMLLPPLVGGLWSWSWAGALTAFFWGSLVRVAVLHHVTFAINSVCHMTGRRPFNTKDESRNVWWLAIPSMGESWHNFHHAEPTSARHGVCRYQVDTSAAVIKGLERLHWISDVRWPTPVTVKRLVPSL